MGTSRVRSQRRPLKGAWRAGAHRVVVELPLLVWLTLVWGALWRDFTFANLLFGLIISVVLVRAFRLPAVRLSGRFHLGKGIAFLAWFAWHVFLGSFQVLWVAVTKGPKVTNAVVRVPLRTRDDLILTGVAHVTSLIPGSLVVEVDRRHSVLFLHVLDVNTEEEAEKFRRTVLHTEAMMTRVMGSKQDVERVNAAEAEDAKVATVQEAYDKLLERKPKL